LETPAEALSSENPGDKRRVMKTVPEKQQIYKYNPCNGREGDQPALRFHGNKYINGSRKKQSLRAPSIVGKKIPVVHEFAVKVYYSSLPQPSSCTHGGVAEKNHHSFQARSVLMGKRLYVGNLSYSLRDDDLQQMFSTSGTVVSAQVIMDRSIGRSKGFGFVEMDSEEEAQAAIAAFNGKDVEGRPLTVNEARPKAEGVSRGRNEYN
jgi:cold-inducible RNA-binding protein